MIFEFSCRKNFTDPVEFSDNLLYRRVDEKETSFYSTGYDVFFDKSITQGSLRNVVVLVHGYRGIFSNVQNKYFKIFNLNRVSKKYNTFIFFYWPSSWSSTIGFIGAKKRVPETSGHLYDLIKMLEQQQKLGKCGSITISSHSLGCDVVFNSKTKNIANWKWLAPAINIKEFVEKRNEITYNTNTKFNIYYSKNDSVLKYWFRMVPGNWFYPAVGYNAKLVPNIEKLKYICNLELHDMSDFVFGHSDYDLEI
jgi:esterase/lipase superfamily enzyme